MHSFRRIPGGVICRTTFFDLMIAMPFFIGLADVSNIQEDLSNITTRNIVLLFTGIMLLIVVFCFIISKKYPIFLTIVVGTFFALGAYYMQAYTSMLAVSGYIFPQDLVPIVSQASNDPNVIIANIFFSYRFVPSR